MLRHYTSDTQALAAVATLPVVQRLTWFKQCVQEARVRGGPVFLGDLRVGGEPDYTCDCAIAQRDGGGWRAIAPQQLRWPWQASKRLPDMCQRIWHEPAQATAGNSGATPAASASK